MAVFVFFIGLFIGTVLGIVVMSCFSANSYNKGYEDRRIDEVARHKK